MRYHVLIEFLYFALIGFVGTILGVGFVMWLTSRFFHMFF